MLPLFLCRGETRGDTLGVTRGDMRFRDTVRAGDRLRRRAPFMGFVRAPPTNRTRRGGGFGSLSKSDAARRSSGV